MRNWLSLLEDAGDWSNRYYDPDDVLQGIDEGCCANCENGCECETEEDLARPETVAKPLGKKKTRKELSGPKRLKKLKASIEQVDEFLEGLVNRLTEAPPPAPSCPPGQKMTFGTCKPVEGLSKDTKKAAVKRIRKNRRARLQRTLSKSSDPAHRKKAQSMARSAGRARRSRLAKALKK